MKLIIVSLSVFFLTSSPLTLADNAISGTVTIIKPTGKARNLRGNVVVFVEATKGQTSLGEDVGEPAENPQISQRARRFRPHVLPIRLGTGVDFLNDDRVLHNVYSLSRSNPFDLGNYEAGGHRSVTFDQPGLVKVYCNIHPKMVMNVLVLSQQHFTKTDVDGNYEINGIPDGDYTIKLWHEWAELTSEEVGLSGSVNHKLNFTIKETKAYVQHKNKFGRNFDSKY